MYQQVLLFLVILFNVTLGQSPRVEYVNAGTEDLFVTLLHKQISFLLGAGETYMITEFSNYYADDIWAYLAKCQNQSCDYPYTRSGLVMQPFTDNVNDTLASYILIPAGYNRPSTIESLDNPDCLVASCEINLQQDCPEELQVKDNEGLVVACDIKDPDTYMKFCPNSVQIQQDGTLGWFSCQGSRVFRISLK